MLRGAVLGSRGANLAGLGVSQCAPLARDGMKGRILPRQLKFSGANNVQVPDAPSLRFGAGSYSIEASINRQVAGAFVTVIGKGTNLNSDFRAFVTNTNILILYGGPDAGGNYPAGPTIPLNVPVHAVWGYDARLGAVFYGLNGLYYKINVANKALTGTQDLRLGSDASVTYYFPGTIDNPRIYNRALAPYEIAEHYRGIFSNNDGLVGRWDLDEADGLIAYDKSGYGNHGTLVGGPQRVQIFKPDRLPV
jgi:Concanavalin A-like lectin/glucanases superfamily